MNQMLTSITSPNHHVLSPPQGLALLSHQQPQSAAQCTLHLRQFLRLNQQGAPRTSSVRKARLLLHRKHSTHPTFLLR